MIGADPHTGSVIERMRLVAAAAENPPLPVEDVWLTGPLALGLAHALSDVDIVMVTATGAHAVESDVRDGIRVDYAVASRKEIDEDRAYLADFDVTYDDIESFRRVRGRMRALTRLATAVDARRDGTPVLAGPELRVYQSWLLADQVEDVHSLTEDLVGLITDDLLDSAGIVWAALLQRLRFVVLAAAGAPLLGAKWLPQLSARYADCSAVDRLAAAVAADGIVSVREHFPAVQTIVFEALAAGQRAAATAAEGSPAPTGFGWLPQVYADGWFVRLGEERRRLTPGQVLGWQEAIKEKTRG